MQVSRKEMSNLHTTISFELSLQSKIEYQNSTFSVISVVSINYYLAKQEISER